MQLIERSARIAATEASADGICWTFSPMVDIARDPRWGRVAEGGGEDAYLGSQIAKAMVKGYQGDDLSKNNTIMACVKHYALYGAAEAGRDYNTTDMSRVRMYNEYLPPYKAAVDAGAGSVMSSFNEVDGVPATANKFLMTDVLRRQWGFKGFVVTDYTAINEMIDHGYRTIFPIPLGEAASWDTAAIWLSARIAATEAAAAGVHWTFAPMVDIARDPRWGRVMEGAGEDPYLGSLIAAARVKGFQGKGLGSVDALMACAKHFAAYGGAIGGRDYNSVDMSEKTLWEIYLPPFKAAADAGVATFMPEI